MKKICKCCGLELELDNYYKSKRHTHGYELKCKKCFQKKSRIRYKENPEKQKNIQSSYYERNPDAKRKIQIKYNYGISLEEYNTMLKKQNNSCAICEKPCELLVRSFDVDHCHKTGKIRGLLCAECNRGIGLFKDNPEFLIKAANYLKMIK